MAFVDAALAVGSFVGADALGATAATLIGGGIMGAGAGALYGGLTGGNIGKDALMGAGIGAGGAGAASALGAGAAGASGVVPGATGATLDSVAGPAATTFNPSTAAMVNAANASTDPIGMMSYMQGASPADLATATGPGAGLTSGFNQALSWMGDHPIMTGLGVLAGANALGLNKPTQSTLPSSAPGNMDTNYYKLNPATFQPNRPQPVTNPVLPSYTNYVQNPYNYQGYAGGGITSLKSGGSSNSNLSEYEQMMTGQQGMGDNYAQMMTGQGEYSIPSVSPLPSVSSNNQLVDENTKGLSPYDAAKYRLAMAFKGAGMPTNASAGITATPSSYGQISTDPAMVQAAMAQQQQAVQGSAQGGIMGYAAGGIPQYNLGGYANGGNPRLLQGPGDGMSDNIPATIADKQPARLADGEFVVPADVVSHLGNGSTDAGAKKLHGMMDKVRQKRTGKKKQAPAINPDSLMPQ